jgi:hypothetical protein
MRTREPILALALVLLAGCASTHAPSHFLPVADDAGRTARGGWLVAEIREPGAAPRREVMGELLAVAPDSVYLETARGFEALPIADLGAVRLARYNSSWPTIAGLTVGGVLWTASHGVFLILTAPLWILTGTISAAVVSRGPIVSPETDGWHALGAFARFPQGLPPEYPRGAGPGASDAGSPPRR